MPRKCHGRQAAPGQGAEVQRRAVKFHRGAVLGHAGRDALDGLRLHHGEGGFALEIHGAVQGEGIDAAAQVGGHGGGEGAAAGLHKAGAQIQRLLAQSSFLGGAAGEEHRQQQWQESFLPQVPSHPLTARVAEAPPGDPPAPGHTAPACPPPDPPHGRGARHRPPPPTEAARPVPAAP